MIGKWVRTAPAAAAARVAQMPRGFLRKEALDLVAGKWAEADLPAALAWAAALPDDASPDRSRAKSAPLVKVLDVWLDRDPAAALAWVKQMPDPGRQLEVFKNVIDSMKSSDLERAAQWVPNLFPAGAAQDGIWTDLVERWSMANPSSALAWVNAQTDPRLAEALCSSVCRVHKRLGAVQPRRRCTDRLIPRQFDGRSRRQGKTRVHSLDADLLGRRRSQGGSRMAGGAPAECGGMEFAGLGVDAAGPTRGALPTG